MGRTEPWHWHFPTQPPAPSCPWPGHGEPGVLVSHPDLAGLPGTVQAAVCARGARGGCGVWGCPAQGDKWLGVMGTLCASLGQGSDQWPSCQIAAP